MARKKFDPMAGVNAEKVANAEKVVSGLGAGPKYVQQPTGPKFSRKQFENAGKSAGSVMEDNVEIRLIVLMMTLVRELEVVCRQRLQGQLHEYKYNFAGEEQLVERIILSSVHHKAAKNPRHPSDMAKFAKEVVIPYLERLHVHVGLAPPTPEEVKEALDGTVPEHPDRPSVELAAGDAGPAGTEELREAGADCEGDRRADGEDGTAGGDDAAPV